MAAEGDLRAAIEAELERTKMQKKVVSRDNLQETMEEAIAFFQERGYKAGRTGRPNQVYVRGGREGILPRVHAELLIQVNVGKGRATMISISGAGEKLSKVLEEYAEHVRQKARAARAKGTEDTQGGV